MSTLIVAGVLVGSVLAICLLLISIHNKHKRQAMNALLKHFNEIGIENNLSFSGKQVLSNCILGLDGINRKILVVAREDGFYSSLIINLGEVKSCKVKKIYCSIKAGDLKGHKPEQLLEKIILEFEFNHKAPIEIAFYKNHDNHIYETQELEQKARQWEAILSKMQNRLKQVA